MWSCRSAANAALRHGLRDYDKRHGWRGATRNLLAEGAKDLQSVSLPDWKFPIRADDIVEGVVLEVSKTNATVKIAEYEAALTLHGYCVDECQEPRRDPQARRCCPVPDPLDQCSGT